MKKLSLLSLLWLVALVAMPIYAQNDLDAEDVVYNVETSTYGDDEVLPLGEDVSFDYGVDEDGGALETAVEDLDFNALFENEEVKAALNEAGLTNEEAAWIFGGLIGLFVGLGIVGAIIFLVWLILCHIALWSIFWRAWEWKWKSLIPIYNLYIVFKIAGIKNWFWYILLIILIAAIFSAIFPALQESLSDYSGEIVSTIILLAWFLLAKKFGRGDSAAILYVIFSGIAVLILWFWNYKYQWKSEKEPETIVEA